MTEAEVATFLADHRKLSVATIGPDGQPHVVAMWYVVIDGIVTFATFAKSQKILNLQRDRRITALVESGESYAELRGVELVGTARIIHDIEQVERIAIAIARKYESLDMLNEAAVAAIRRGARKRVGVALELHRVVSWDHSKPL